MPEVLQVLLVKLDGRVVCGKKIFQLKICPEVR